MSDTLSAVERREAGNRLYVEAQGRMALLPNYYRWIISRFLPHIRGTVLELGVGVGLEIEHYKHRAKRIIGVDYNADLLALLKDRYPDPQITTAKIDLRGEWNELEDVEPVDTLLALDVMEHFEDHEAFAAKMATCLAPGGVVCLKVPGQSSLYGEVDKASGHFRRYDPHPLARLMQAAGFEVVEQRWMNPVGALGYRFKRAKNSNYSKTFSPSTLRAINAAIPALALIDRAANLPGLSLTGVYRKAAS